MPPGTENVLSGRDLNSRYARRAPFFFSTENTPPVMFYTLNGSLSLYAIIAWYDFAVGDPSGLTTIKSTQKVSWSLTSESNCSKPCQCVASGSTRATFELPS